MYYGHNLRSNLQEWRNRLYKSNFENVNNNFVFFLNRLAENPVIQGILKEAMENTQTNEEVIIKQYESLFNSDYARYPNFSSEEQCVAVLYGLISLCSEKNKEARSLSFALGDGSKFNEQFDSFMENYVEPIINYVHDRLDESNSVIYLLEKYKKRTEWFLKNNLLSTYNNSANKFEQIFEDDLRLFLFDQGIDNPFSTPKSASGRADIVGLIDTKNPLILEVKIYDSNKGYRKNRIIEGFSQIVKYSNDYNKQAGYLVVFNMDNKEIEISSDDSDRTFPARIIFNNKVFYIVIINLNFEVSASKTGLMNAEIISKNELISCMD